MCVLCNQEKQGGRAGGKNTHTRKEDTEGECLQFKGLDFPSSPGYCLCLAHRRCSPKGRTSCALVMDSVVITGVSLCIVLALFQLLG